MPVASQSSRLYTHLGPVFTYFGKLEVSLNHTFRIDDRSPTLGN